MHFEPSHWLHEIFVSKIVHHHFWPRLIPPLLIGVLTSNLLQNTKRDKDLYIKIRMEIHPQKVQGMLMQM